MVDRHRHVCWAYDDPVGFTVRAKEWIAEGIAAGNRVWFVADEGTKPIEGARLIRIAEAYDDEWIIDPPAQVRAYAAATEQALADGYTGFRVVAEVTPLVRDAAGQEAFARYEYLVEQYMSTAPMSALCAYDQRELGWQVVAELAGLHPETNVGVLFSLRAGADGGGVVLSGELDQSNRAVLGAAMRRADLGADGEEIVFDAAGLRFIDHRTLLDLEDYAEERHTRVVLRTGLISAVKLVELLGLRRVRVEPAR
ncbi:MEDS domain-containing protein [Dactylosporangium roseum]|uniref:MEDS domain-containing protein n=1 Tax=Dactylosporangium roseum TaxID=47989 RepID=A0ABY5Z2R0_9ACTN|nr:MEDS domain-containing protein [Dactylosporangium roseum]UWZ35043.1 MEDS domain-containing protein [Dactylosporangium roseum]